MKPIENITVGLILMGLAGCNLGAASMTEEQFCQEYAKRECAKVATYCSVAPTSCEPARVSACRERATSSKTGTRRFNPDNADACLNQVNTAYATPLIDAAHLAELDRVCARVFEGTAKASDACTADFDCQKGLVCDKGACGTPRVASSLGGCANVGESCPPGEYCSNINTTRQYFCTRRQGQGAACSDSQPCLEDLRCAGTCGPRLDTGMPCGADDECKLAYCNVYVPAGSPRTCGPGLAFAIGSPSCLAFTAQ
jgi:hypothetical protein